MSRARRWGMAISTRTTPCLSPTTPSAARAARCSRRSCGTVPPASFRARSSSSPARRRPTVTRSASRSCSTMTASSLPSRNWKSTPMTWRARTARPLARSTRTRSTTCARAVSPGRLPPTFWCSRSLPRRWRRSQRRACATRLQPGYRAGWSGGAADAGHARHHRHLSGAAPGGAAPARNGPARGSRSGDPDRGLRGGVRRAMAAAGAPGASDGPGAQPALGRCPHGVGVHRAAAALRAGAGQPRSGAAHRRARHGLRGPSGAVLGLPGGKPADPAARAGGRVCRTGAGIAGCRADLVWRFRLVLDIRSERGGMERVMTGEAFWSLVRQTLFEPRDAAQRIVSSGLSARDGWLALALMAVLNTLVYSLSARLNPPADPAMSEMMGPALGAPLVFAAALFAALALTAVAFRQAGRALGGTATTTDMLVLLAWMQALRLMVQVVLVVLAMAMPALAGIVVIVAAVWGLWILLAFMAEAHGFESLWRAAGALAIAFAGLVFGLSLLFSLVGMRVAGGM